MIVEAVTTFISMMIAITIILWIPFFMLKALPRKAKYNGLIKALESVNKKIKRVWDYIFFILMTFVYLAISSFIGVSSKPLIYRLNSPLGEGYAIWASYAITALMFSVLSRHLTLTKDTTK